MDDRAAALEADRALVGRIVGGDQEAFRILVERESIHLFRACYRVLGRLHEAEDAAQESLVMAYRALGTYRGEGPLGAWLARIATRHAFRRLNQRRDTVSLDPIAPFADSRGTALDPLGSALAQERETQVRQAVAALPEPYREVVALRFFSDLSLNEIAVMTGRPLGTVKTHLHRGLGRLRQALAAEAFA